MAKEYNIDDILSEVKKRREENERSLLEKQESTAQETEEQTADEPQEFSVIIEKAEKGEDGGYTADELTFGRDNLKFKNADFKEYLLKKRAELVIAREKAVNVTEIDERIKKYTEISDEL